MLPSSTATVATWAGGAIAATAMTGLGWAMNPVEVPIIWLMVLTFVPTSDIITIVRANLERFDPASEDRKNGD